MANLTITVPEEVLRKARIRALQTGISVNALLRETLEAFAGSRNEQMDAVSDLLDLSRSSQTRRGSRSWTRDDLHERNP